MNDNKNHFDFKDLMAVGMFILSLLTFIYMICGVLPVKRTMKNNKFFSVSLLTGWRYFYAAFNVSS